MKLTGLIFFLMFFYGDSPMKLTLIWMVNVSIRRLYYFYFYFTVDMSSEEYSGEVPLFIRLSLVWHKVISTESPVKIELITLLNSDLFGCLGFMAGIWIFVGYLMPNPFLYK